MTFNELVNTIPVHRPADALQMCKDNHELVCRPILSGRCIVMHYESGIEQFAQEDNGVRLTMNAPNSGPAWYLDGVKWVVFPFTDIALAFTNYEDPDFLKLHFL